MNDEEFFDTYFSDNYAIVCAISYGSYNINDEYVKFDAYGNLESISIYEYEKELVYYLDEIIDAMLDIKSDLDLSSNLKHIIMFEE